MQEEAGGGKEEARGAWEFRREGTESERIEAYALFFFWHREAH
jgi:hypothetical protein